MNAFFLEGYPNASVCVLTYSISFFFESCFSLFNSHTSLKVVDVMQYTTAPVMLSIIFDIIILYLQNI